MSKISRFILATVLAAAFFFAGVRFCVLAQHIEVVGHNGDDYVCTVEVFGQEDFHFANWNPLSVKENSYGIVDAYKSWEV